jgi:hypothetical protein
MTVATMGRTDEEIQRHATAELKWTLGSLPTRFVGREARSRDRRRRHPSVGVARVRVHRAKRQIERLGAARRPDAEHLPIRTEGSKVILSGLCGHVPNESKPSASPGPHLE